MRSESPNIYDAESKYANFAGVVFVRHSKGRYKLSDNLSSPFLPLREKMSLDFVISFFLSEHVVC